MANEVLFKTGSQWLFADATDFPSSGAGPPTTGANSLIVGTPTKVQLDLTAIATGAARSSAKATLSTPWGLYSVDACLEFASAPTDGEIVDFYWAASPSSTTGTGNPAGLSGSDSDHTDSTGTLGQMIYIGSLVLRANATNIGHVGRFVPPYEYGMLVVVNQATPALNSDTNMDETHIVMTELITEIQ